MTISQWRLGALAVAASVALTACDLDNSGSSSANGTTPDTSTQGGPNTVPTLAGNPSLNAVVGVTYVFQPSAADADGDALTFSISGLPAWASFNSRTGTISGTPTAGNAGTSSAVTISVTDGEANASLPAFTIVVTNTPTQPGTPTGTNAPPVITGSPSNTVQANSGYSFTPSASDVNGDALGFTITGKPVWAAFSTATGALTGTPTTAQVGTYSNIVITVSDGRTSQALPAFAITVASAAASGSATLTWTAPTQNTDGSQLTNLSGYRIYHGTSASSLTDIRSVAANSSTYQFTSLGSGSHYFAISAYNAEGTESSLSVVGSKTIQ